MKTELNSKQALKELIAKLPIEKRMAIVEKLSCASMAINSIECMLHETELEHASLFDGEQHPTLWCQIYALEKLFETI